MILLFPKNPLFQHPCPCEENLQNYIPMQLQIMHPCRDQAISNGNLYFYAKQPLQHIKSHCRTAPIQLQKGDSTDQNIALDTPL
jgi:hypothetical protein